MFYLGSSEVSRNNLDALMDIRIKDPSIVNFAGISRLREKKN